MKRKLKRGVFLVTALLCAVTPLFRAPTVSAYELGDGTAELPYQITTCMELQAMYEDKTAHYELANDIDCSETVDWNDGHGFGPIGDMEVTEPFVGTFDGKGHTISHLYQNWLGVDIIHVGGLFGAIDGGSVSNVALSDVSIQANNNTGAIAGMLMSNGSVTNVAVTGTVKGIGVGYEGLGFPIGAVGGVVGFSLGEVAMEQISFDGTLQVGITGEEMIIMAAGGMVGVMTYGATLRDSYANADVSSLTDGQVVVAGGVGGSLYFDETTPVLIENTYAAGTVTAEPNNLASGFIGGFQYGAIHNTFSASLLTYEPVVSVGTVGGFMGSTPGLIMLENDYLDGRRSGYDTCTGSDDLIPGCRIVNTDEEPDADYFYDPSSRPLSSWDFTDVWLAHPGDYPTLRHSIIVAPPDETDEEPATHHPIPKDSPTVPFFPSTSSPTTQKTKDESPSVVQTPDVTVPQTGGDPTSEKTSSGGDAFFWTYIAIIGAGAAGVGVLLTIRYFRRK